MRSVSAGEIPELAAEKYLLVNGRSGELMCVERGEKTAVTLEYGGYTWLLFLPLREKVTPIGLTDKYISFHAVENVCEDVSGEHCFIRLREGGRFAFFVKKGVKVSRFFGNGRDLTDGLSGKRMEEGTYNEIRLGEEPVQIEIQLTAEE